MTHINRRFKLIPVKCDIPVFKTGINLKTIISINLHSHKFKKKQYYSLHTQLLKEFNCFEYIGCLHLLKHIIATKQ